MAIKQSPLITQYLNVKRKVPDAILFFRLGDFYEMFFEDAEVGARILDIQLTSDPRTACRCAACRTIRRNHTSRSC